MGKITFGCLLPIHAWMMPFPMPDCNNTWNALIIMNPIPIIRGFATSMAIVWIKPAVKFG